MINAFAVKVTLHQFDAGEPGTWLNCQLYLHSAPEGRGTAVGSILQARELGQGGAP